MSKQYVQHISGQGEKWELQCGDYNSQQHRDDFLVHSKTGRSIHCLPKSEYRLCEPPEVWRDCTERIDVGHVIAGGFSGTAIWNVSLTCPTQDCSNVYRLRKVTINGCDCPKVAFIVEKKVSE